MNPRQAQDLLDVLASLASADVVRPIVKEVYNKLSDLDVERMTKTFTEAFAEKLDPSKSDVPGRNVQFFDDPEVAVYLTALQKQGIAFHSIDLGDAIRPLDDGRFFLEIDTIQAEAAKYKPGKAIGE